MKVVKPTDAREGEEVVMKEKYVDETFADGVGGKQPVARYTTQQKHLELEPGNIGILIQFPWDWLLKWGEGDTEAVLLRTKIYHMVEIHRIKENICALLSED